MNRTERWKAKREAMKKVTQEDYKEYVETTLRKLETEYNDMFPTSSLLLFSVFKD